MRVAITGGIAEGKSTVMAMLRELGCETASSDETARLVFQNYEVQTAIADLLGLSELPVMPVEVRAAIARDVSIRRSINRIMHPRIRAEMSGNSAPFHEVPLLFEACLQGNYDRVWVVTCGKDEQRRRLFARVKDLELTESLLNTQIPTRAKVPFADEVIDTSGELHDVRHRVEDLVAGLNL